MRVCYATIYAVVGREVSTACGPHGCPTRSTHAAHAAQNGAHSTARWGMRHSAFMRSMAASKKAVLLCLTALGRVEPLADAGAVLSVTDSLRPTAAACDWPLSGCTKSLGFEPSRHYYVKFRDLYLVSTSDSLIKSILAFQLDMARSPRYTDVGGEYAAWSGCPRIGMLR